MEQTINKNFNSLDTLVSLFGINYSNLAKLIYPTTNNLYHSFSIPKKSGELREINAPNRILKEIQYKLLNELQSYYSKRNCTHGFINERNVVTNARPHVKKNIILNLDLKEFFQSIHFGRVRNLFMSNPFNFNKNVATVLAQICCHKGHLPQGAPTSPLITNLICYKLDKELSKLAFNNNCTVTRYVDDITFSFNCSHDKIPRDILDGISGESISISKKLVNIINKNGFEINYKKVRLSSSNQRQQVTGIVTNVKVNLPRKYIKKTQSMLYAWKNFSLPNAEQAHINNYLEKPYK
ncbi:TPA: RNA-directed DNA polymerase, partial [Legionella pneumophila]|nr:RNA-directed DNA polymerase [Legionella pneumophila]